VQRRFYRSDKIRNTPGVGLGLNLVAAIVKLHGFNLKIFAGPGCRVEIICPDGPTWTQSGLASSRIENVMPSPDVAVSGT
jgi:signal transduction histidine kinase